MAFWKDVADQIKKAIMPIPKELQKEYAFWESRKFSPEVNAKLIAIQNQVSPVVVKAIIDSLGKYKLLSASMAEKKIREVFDKIADILND